MTKMNRRDCLIGMGATAGMLASVPKMHLFAQEHGSTRAANCGSDKDRVSDLYVPCGADTYDLLPNETVKLVFYGLMYFSHNNGTECEVGFHAKDSDKHRHALKIRVYRMPGCHDMYASQYPHGIPVPSGTPLGLRIERPDKINGTLFYQPPPVAGVFHRNDFRWVMDLESENFYGRPLQKKPGVYNTKLVVKNGLFYTLKKSESTFRRQTPDGDENHVKRLGNVAEYIAANIYLKTRGSVHLSIGSMSIPLPQASGVRYEVHFDNGCVNKTSDLACVFRPYHLHDKTERNDFYMNFDGIDLAPGRLPEYELVLEQAGTPRPPGICVPHRVTDEAPCSGVGYGGSAGFPGYPPTRSVR